MIKLPNCDFCKNRIDKGDKCKAYPNGIPLEAMIKTDMGVECGKGYYFEPKEEDSENAMMKSNGLLSRMFDTIGDSFKE